MAAEKTPPAKPKPTAADVKPPVLHLEAKDGRPSAALRGKPPTPPEKPPAKNK